MKQKAQVSRKKKELLRCIYKYIYIYTVYILQMMVKNVCVKEEIAFACWMYLFMHVVKNIAMENSCERASKQTALSLLQSTFFKKK